MRAPLPWPALAAKSALPFVFLAFLGVAWSSEQVRSAPKSLGTPVYAGSVKLGPASLSAGSLSVVTKPAIAHNPKPLTTTGLPTGSPVDPNLMVDVGGGKKVRASALLDGTNGLESNLNALGYSMYDDESDTTTPIVTLRPAVDGLSAQAQRLTSLGGMKGSAPVKVNRDIETELNTARGQVYGVSGSKLKPVGTVTSAKATTAPGSFSSTSTTPKSTATPPKGEGTTAPAVGGKRGRARLTPKATPTSTSGAVVQDPTVGKKPKGGKRFGDATVPRGTAQPSGQAAQAAVPQVVDKKYTLFDESFGDRDWFSVELSSSLTKHADMKLRKVTALADVKAYLIGKSISVFHAKAEAGGTRDLAAGSTPQFQGKSESGNQAILTLESTLLGDDLFTPVHRTNSGRAKKNLSGKSVGWEYTVKIPIIPAVSAEGTIGTRGSLGVDLVANADSSGGDISIVPNIDATVYAEAGISVGFVVASVEGGLGANLTLIDYELDISAGVTPVNVQIGTDVYYAASCPITVSHSLDTLKGNLYGYARVSYWLPFKTREKTLWQGDLFSWNGFSDSRVLLSEGTDDPVVIGRSPFATAVKFESVAVSK